MLTRDTTVDCGAIVVEIFNAVSLGALDSELFLEDRSVAGSYNLMSLYTENVDKKGQYQVSYRAYHAPYTSNVIELDTPFVVSIMDPCEAPKSLTPSTL